MEVRLIIALRGQGGGLPLGGRCPRPGLFSGMGTGRKERREEREQQAAPASWVNNGRTVGTRWAQTCVRVCALMCVIYLQSNELILSAQLDQFLPMCTLI